MSKNADTAKRRISFEKLQQASVLILVLVLGLVASRHSDTFLSWGNIVDNLFTNAAAKHLDL